MVVFEWYICDLYIWFRVVMWLIVLVIGYSFICNVLFDAETWFVVCFCWDLLMVFRLALRYFRVLFSVVLRIDGVCLCCVVTCFDGLLKVGLFACGACLWIVSLG